jgi:hypothetical protein
MKEKFLQIAKVFFSYRVRPWIFVIAVGIGAMLVFRAYWADQAIHDWSVQREMKENSLQLKNITLEIENAKGEIVSLRVKVSPEIWEKISTYVSKSETAIKRTVDISTVIQGYYRDEKKERMKLWFFCFLLVGVLAGNITYRTILWYHERPVKCPQKPITQQI